MLNKSPQAQRGATLIEVLVTLIILSVGLLGMAGLQTLSMQSNHSAYYRSQATFLAYDISERMRANRTVALSGGYSVDFPESSSAHAESGDRVTKDKAQWLNKLATTLPNGTGKVELNGTLVAIKIRWDDSRGDIRARHAKETSSEQETFVYRTEI